MTYLSCATTASSNLLALDPRSQIVCKDEARWVLVYTFVPKNLGNRRMMSSLPAKRRFFERLLMKCL